MELLNPNVSLKNLNKLLSDEDLIRDSLKQQFILEDEFFSYDVIAQITFVFEKQMNLEMDYENKLLNYHVKSLHGFISPKYDLDLKVDMNEQQLKEISEIIKNEIIVN